MPGFIPISAGKDILFSQVPFDSVRPPRCRFQRHNDIEFKLLGHFSVGIDLVSLECSEDRPKLYSSAIKRVPSASIISLWLAVSFMHM